METLMAYTLPRTLAETGVRYSCHKGTHNVLLYADPTGAVYICEDLNLAASVVNKMATQALETTGKHFKCRESTILEGKLWGYKQEKASIKVKGDNSTIGSDGLSKMGSCLFIDKGTWSLDGWLASALELPRADDVYKPVFVDMAVMHSISFGQSQGSDLIAYTHFWDPKALWNERNVDSRNLRTLPMSPSPQLFQKQAAKTVLTPEKLERCTPSPCGGVDSDSTGTNTRSRSVKQAVQPRNGCNVFTVINVARNEALRAVLRQHLTGKIVIADG
ncbi:hypothetical protein V8E55_007694 [Tylopilus felleus]